MVAVVLYTWRKGERCCGKCGRPLEQGDRYAWVGLEPVHEECLRHPPAGSR
jgi:hypothetical protein